MTKQVIDLGTGANDNNGDPLRTAFTKVNSNFTELYTLIGSGSGNVIDVVGPLLNHSDHTNVTVTLDSVNDRIVLDAQFNEIIQDLKGSVFADDSSIMVDSVDNKIYASGGIYGDLKGTVVGDDSTVIVDGTGSYVNLDGTVKGSIVPDQDIAYDIGSPTKRFNDLYLSGNTMFLGNAVLSATASGGLSLPQGSTIPGVTDVKFRPDSIFDDRQQGQQYYATGAPASATVIDQATWIWSDPAKRYPTFQPSVYSATIDGNGNITGIALTTSNYYEDTSEQWETINTDNLIALDAGIDITDPAAIRASSYSEVLPATVNSTGDSVLSSGSSVYISIAELKNIVASSIDFNDFKTRIAAL